MRNETKFVKDLVDRIETEFPGCMVIKNDPTRRQGILDLLVLYGPRWAMLEAKATKFAPRQPNQEYYVNLLNEMSFAAVIYPENEEEVMHELQRALRPSGTACLPQCK